MDPKRNPRAGIDRSRERPSARQAGLPRRAPQACPARRQAPGLSDGSRPARPRHPAAPGRLRALLQRRPALPARRSCAGASRPDPPSPQPEPDGDRRRQLPHGRPRSPLQQLQRALQPPPARPRGGAAPRRPPGAGPRPPRATIPRSADRLRRPRRPARRPRRSTRGSSRSGDAPSSTSTASRPILSGRWPPSGRRRAATEVQFRLAAEDGKVKLKARPVGEPARAPRRRISVRRRSSWILVSSLAALTAAVAIAAPGGGAAEPDQGDRGAAPAHRRAAPGPRGVQRLRQPPDARPASSGEAEAAYRKAIELDPNKASALFNLGLLLQQRGRAARGLTTLPAGGEDRSQARLGPLPARHHLRGPRPRTRRRSTPTPRAFALDPQLAFPEVNPQIVDNKLVTQAMLRAYKNDFAGNPQAPKMYDDAARIAALLVPKPAPARGRDRPRPRTSSASRRPASGRGGAGERRRPATGGGREHRARASGISTAATPPARPGLAVARVRRPASRGSAGCAQWSRPEPTIQEVPGGDDEDGDQPQVITPPPGGVYYRAGHPEHRPAEPADRSGSGGSAVGSETRDLQGTAGTPGHPLESLLSLSSLVFCSTR